MRKLPLFIILLLAILCSCSKKDNRIFRWNDLSPQADSLVQRIEWAHLNLCSPESLLKMIDDVESNTDILKTNPEFTYFKRAQIYRDLGYKDSAKILICKADAYCDSAKHPYEKHRINISKSNELNAYFKDFLYLENAKRYAIDTQDSFLLGITSNTLGIIFGELGDSVQCKEYNTEAVECYKAVNLSRLAQSLELNFLPDIFSNGDTLRFKSMLYAMKEDNALMMDSSFRVNLMIDAASFLGEDWAIDSLYAITTRPHGLSPYHESTFLAFKADQIRRQGDIKKGYEISLRSVEIADNSDNIELMAKIYPHHAVFCYLAGMPDSAFIYHQTAFFLQDSLSKEDTRTKILRATERLEIEKSILTKKNKEIKRWLIVCLIISTIVILVLGFAIWLAIRNGRLKLEAERAKTDTERNRQLVGQTMLRLHQKNQSIQTLSDHIEEHIPHSDDLPGLHKEQRILALNERGDKALETTSKLIDEVSSNLVVNLRKRVPNISKNMLQLAVLIACDIPNKEIAEMLGVQPESIRKQRYRLRTLLNLSREEKLEDVLSSMC